jgi:hypothetical protein
VRGTLLAVFLGLCAGCTADNLVGAVVVKEAALSLGPVALPRFGTTLPDGTPFQGQIRMCRTLKLGSPDLFPTNRMRIESDFGATQVAIFRSEADFADQVFPCPKALAPEDWVLLAESRERAFDWTLPDGKRFLLRPHAQLLLQATFENSTTVALSSGARATLFRAEGPLAAAPTGVAETLAADNRHILIPARSEATVSRDCRFAGPAEVLVLYGQMNSCGVGFRVDRLAADGDTHLETLYQSEGTPPFTDYGGQLHIEGGQTLRFGCWYKNETDHAILYGSRDDQERCNLLVHFVPTGAGGQVPTCALGADSPW